MGLKITVIVETTNDGNTATLTREVRVPVGDNPRFYGDSVRSVMPGIGNEIAHQLDRLSPGTPLKVDR